MVVIYTTRLLSEWHTMRKLLLAATITTFWCFSSVLAADYPIRPITFVVPFAPGGPTDTLGRKLAERMSGILGQTIVIENVAGAGGSVGVGRAVNAAPDGYTISVGNWSTHVLNGAIYGLASHGRMLGAFKPANRSRDVQGLYLAGGAAHPGPGMPMVLMSGWIAADSLDRDGIVPGGARARRSA